MQWCIVNTVKPGKRCVDPFVGSGTTIIAAEMTGRACHAIEISPAYVDVALLRWQAFTGATATHALTGRSFADTAAERAAQPAEAA
jgi:DNA modification methylase